MIFTSMLYTLLSTAATLRRDMSILYSRVAVTTLLKCFHVSLLILFLYVSLSKGIGLYGGLYHTTSLIHIFHIFIFLVSAVILQLTAFYPSKVWFKEYASLFYLILKFFYYSFLHNYTQILNKMGQQFKIIEYPLIILFIIIGAMFLVSTSDIVSLFLSIELQSYGLYLLSTLYRDSELSTSAGLTYFLLGGLSSCFILLGTSLLYANSATTTLDGVYVITSLSFISNKDINNVFYWYKPSYINTSLLIMSVGFLFKVSAAPFQFWSPDVYDAIPTIVTTFVAIIAKISIFVFLLELVHYTSNSLSSDEFSWTDSLLISSLLSLIIGTVLGLTQFRIKRLFAYSTISHVGFILLALSINSLESIQAFIFYLMQYTISNLNAFLLLISIGFSKYPSIIFDYFSKHKQTNNLLLLEKNNSPIQLLTQLKGYFFLNPILALSLAITVFSLVGIPPLIGFFAKQMVLSAALDSGYVFLTLIAILTSVVSAVYYLGIIKQIFFDLPEYSLDSLFKEYQSHDNSLEDKLAFKPEDHSIDLLSKYRLPKLSYYHDEEKQENEEKKENTTPFVDQIGKYRIDRDKHIKSILKRALYEYKKQKQEQEQEQEQEKIENLNLNTNNNNNPICLVRRPKYIDIYLFVVKMEKIEQELKKIEQELVKIKQELVKIKNLNENLNKNKNNPTYLYILYNMFLSSSLTITVSSFTLILLLFIFTPREWLNLANLLAIITLNS